MLALVKGGAESGHFDVVKTFTGQRKLTFIAGKFVDKEALLNLRRFHGVASALPGLPMAWLCNRTV